MRGSTQPDAWRPALCYWNDGVGVGRWPFFEVVPDAPDPGLEEPGRVGQRRVRRFPAGDAESLDRVIEAASRELVVLVKLAKRFGQIPLGAADISVGADVAVENPEILVAVIEDQDVAFGGHPKGLDRQFAGQGFFIVERDFRIGVDHRAKQCHRPVVTDERDGCIRKSVTTLDVRLHPDGKRWGKMMDDVVLQLLKMRVHEAS